tara:strand:- start:3496 stop:4122 length:627 start_codon:yes stop_codon:yes gene_type:complete
MLKIDHIVYVTSNVTASTEELTNKLGVAPTFGGSHIGRGTCNALLSLGEYQYLEILGPDPTQEFQLPSERFPEIPLLRTWAARTTNIIQLVESANVKGIDFGSVRDMSRIRADGVKLDWELTTGSGGGLGRDNNVAVLPFLIDWKDSPHPSIDAPSGCSLVELRIEHPDFETIRDQLEFLNLNIHTTYAEESSLTAVIDTPLGQVEIK